ncbi:MAG: hypothetical protein JWO06_2888 [Bacteroidota bacterium]|nr:hypothetical protein [Bacteroidota bacterium]
MLFLIVQSCKTSGKSIVPRNCTPTTEAILNSFPDKTWLVNDSSFYSYCRFYNPIIYFSKDGRCVLSTTEKSIKGMYHLNKCDNLLELYLPGDTLLFIINTLSTSKMNMTEIVALPNNELGAAPWHLTEYIEPKKTGVK